MRRLFAAVTCVMVAALYCSAANAINVRVTLNANPDGVRTTAFPCVAPDASDCAPPTTATLDCNDSAATSLQGLITGNAFSENVRQYYSGTAAATCTLSVATESGDDAATEGWAVSTPNLTHDGGETGAGSLKVGCTDSGNTKYCSVRPWSYVAAAASDTTAPTIPTGCTTTPGSGTVIIECDPSSDPYVSESGSGVDEYDFRLGAAVVHTKTTGVSSEIAPQLTAGEIGEAGTPSAVQTGASWALSSVQGAGYISTSDNGYAVCAPIAGDATITAKLSTYTTAATAARMGVGFRSSLDQNAQLALLFQSSDEAAIGVSAKGRTTIGGGFTSVASALGVGDPSWLQVAAAGDTYTYRYSTDGGVWTQLGTLSISMPTQKQACLMAASHAGGTSLSATFDQVSITQSARISYTHTTATGGSYSVRARDADANNSSYGTAVSGTPDASAASVKWHPGHYLRASTVNQLTASEVSSISASVWKGAEVQYNWSTIETSRGTYNFALVDSHLASLGSKKMILHLKDRTFSGSGTGHLPSYLSSEAGANGGWLVKANNAGVIARQWLPAVADRWIALVQAVCNRYDENSQVEMIIITNESSPSIAQGTEDYTRSALATQTKRVMTAGVAACPHTSVISRANFLAGEISGLLNHTHTVKAGTGGPDVAPPPHADTEAAEIWRGLSTDDSDFPAFDYRGSSPVSFVAASAPYTGGKDGSFTAAQFYDHAYDTLQATHLSWVKRDTGTATWAQIVTEVTANPDMRTTCPTQYASCDTN